ncbi:hypothetical protein BS78_09G010900 [Paspalum vaginatum]|nr:hypothetical protein BS78_09G010900 [Paspalum vaginatum]
MAKARSSSKQSRAGAGAGAGAAAERRRPRALLQARQVPRPGGLLGQGPTARRGALDPPGRRAHLRPALGSRAPRRCRLDRTISGHFNWHYLLVLHVPVED